VTTDITPVPASIMDDLEPREETPTPDVLPRSGKAYSVRPAKGRDLARAQELTKDPNQTSLAFVAVAAKVEGKALTLKDLEAMSLADVTHLISQVMPAGTDSDEPAGDPDPSAPKRLPVSGKTYEVREGLGADLVAAQRAVRRPSQTTLALVAVLTKVEGEQLKLEDVEEMPLADVLQLIGEAMPEGKA
jgi:hypothetical protein